MAKIFISLGSNIEREYYIHQGLQALTDSFGPLDLSPLFESDPVGFSSQAFYNLVVGVCTDKSIAEVQACLKEIEYAHGRVINAQKYTPRTLDLDLLLYDDVISDQPVQLPRQDICCYAFVLWPLAELAGDLVHPVLKQTYRHLWQHNELSHQLLRKVPLNWPE